MNCPSRQDPSALDNDGYNQSPHPLALATNSDMNGLANRRPRSDHKLRHQDEDGLDERIGPVSDVRGTGIVHEKVLASGEIQDKEMNSVGSGRTGRDEAEESLDTATDKTKLPASLAAQLRKLKHILVKFSKFIGPGFMIAVAYIDPGNYATDVAAGASYKFQLLVMVLVSNIIAIFLQSLCIKLGSVTGMDLAQNIKAHCPRWLNIVLYVFAEAAIIVTDIAEVIGTAIALNLLIKVPLVAGCAISIVDVLIILIFYKPTGSMRGVRLFEVFVALLVLAVVVCFCIELSLVKIPNVGQLFRGYLPSSALVQREGLYQACGILGATVMPHSLYLGSGIVHSRLYDYDLRHGHVAPPIPHSVSTTSIASSIDNTSDPTTNSPPSQPTTTTTKSASTPYRPSLPAIRACLSYSIAELAISLFTFALFVNSAILIVAGASLSSNPSAATASLFDIHTLLTTTLAPAAGTVFALALLLSGTSAGIICTIAGQMVSEGQLSLTIAPWKRRLLTRSISITPSIIIAGAVGKEGLTAALEASQVALSVILPVTSAPLIWFTMRGRYMGVEDVVGRGVNGGGSGEKDELGGAGSGSAVGNTGANPDAEAEAETRAPRIRIVNMRNHWLTSTFAVAMWVLIVVMNVASWVMMGLPGSDG